MALRCCRVKIEYDNPSLSFYKKNNVLFILGTCQICNNPILKAILFNEEDLTIDKVIRYNKITKKVADLIDIIQKEYEKVR